MKKFFEKNKVLLAIFIVFLTAGGIIYFSQNKKEVLPPEEIRSSSQEKCPQIPELPNNSQKLVTKVIDGDTFLIEGGYSVRILGIDADERGYPCWAPAKDRLEELILDKKVRLEKGPEDKDKWCRYLRYVFLDNKNVGLILLKEGLAVARLTSNSKYKEEIVQAEKEAREKKIGCKWSFSFAKNSEDKSSFAETKPKWERLTSEATGLEIVDACQAKNFYGKEIIVEGKVVDTYRSKKNNIFLNFGKPYPEQCFSAVIFSSDKDKFIDRPERYYLNKVVRIKGKTKEYKGKPEIILRDSSQIEAGKRN